MSRRPWYKRFPSDFLRGQHGIGPAQIGAYNVIVDVIYDRAGTCPNDPRWIGGFLGCSPRMARSLIDDLLRLDKLYLDAEGFLRNRRADHELAGVTAEHDQAVQSGAKGGQKSAENRAKLSPNSGEPPASGGDNSRNVGTAVNENNGLGQATLDHRAGARARVPDARCQMPEGEAQPLSSNFTTEKPSPLSVPLRGPDGGGGDGPKAQESRKHAPDGFERWWKAAEPPPHASKAKAREAWDKTRHCRPSDDDMIAAHARYRRSVADENDRRKRAKPPRSELAQCHPVTFITERRWEGFMLALEGGAGGGGAAPAPTGPDWGERGVRLAALIGGDAVFASWFGGAVLIDGPPVVIRLEKAFQRNWVANHFQAHLEKVFGPDVRIEQSGAKNAA